MERCMEGALGDLDLTPDLNGQGFIVGDAAMLDDPTELERQW